MNEAPPIPEPLWQTVPVEAQAALRAPLGAVFDLDHVKLAADPRFGMTARELSDQSKIDSRASFTRYCREACRLWNEHFGQDIGKTSPKYAKLLQRVKRGGDGVIKTPWGGVFITVHEHPRVEKYLIIRKDGYLALETHEEKDELLEVQEGAALILFRGAADQPLTHLQRGGRARGSRGCRA